MKTSQMLVQQIQYIYQNVISDIQHILNRYPAVHGTKSRDNLLAFIALQKYNLKELSFYLRENGLASFEDINAHVLYTMKKILTHLNGKELLMSSLFCCSPSEANFLLESRTNRILGNCPLNRRSRIMVTLDAKMIHLPWLMEGLLEKGMDIARINCAHGDPEIWKELIFILRKAEEKLKAAGKWKGSPCKIYMDLSGPKIRISPFIQQKNSPVKIQLSKGDYLRLYLDGKTSEHAASGSEHAGVPVTLKKAFKNVRRGDRIFIDDGKIAGIVHRVEKDFIDIQILSPGDKCVKLKEGKGVNLPDSLVSLNVSALTDKDLTDLPFIVRHADMIGISFVHSPNYLKMIRSHLEYLAVPDMPVIAKIETKAAIHHLGRILLEGLNFKGFGVMIARGDLAIEVGYEQLASAQNQIFNLCSAAHIPVIWATGVLDNLTKKGIPTRAEITDAAFAADAEAIVLNKGKYIRESIEILTQMLAKENSPIGYRHHYNQLGVFN